MIAVLVLVVVVVVVAAAKVAAAAIAAVGSSTSYVGGFTLANIAIDRVPGTKTSPSTSKYQY